MGVLLPSLAPAALPIGQELPFFVGTDLTGTQRRSSELTRQPSVVIAATSRAASGEAHSWARALIERYGNNIPLVTLIAIDLPFFISDDLARGKAREKIPHEYWEQTWLGGEGDIQRALQLEPDSEVPYVFTLDSQGRISAAVHGPVGAPESSRIWQEIQAWRR
ncbi:hypothetical protein D187_003347 [Cystobacter fuscus DSM 2262]|uniref:Thioredoxin domain-containing protein n=1 Tax=Cystobacter fuscus (strain ATCC 25194 / DSM 2262 / NBRC 100088 / M29) TaxID=1242864 RepID=S9P3C2_CYSF2|nr:hypothetical protein [Cystobacter fuscus]EPX58970.1 hypothetical protein D187_003347 [Cystobacter fuscus DSM 2262]